MQSDHGFVVQRIGRFTADYREGQKVVTLDVESGLNGELPCIILDPRDFARWNDRIPIVPDQQVARLRVDQAAHPVTEYAVTFSVTFF